MSSQKTNRTYKRSSSMINNSKQSKKSKLNRLISDIMSKKKHDSRHGKYSSRHGRHSKKGKRIKIRKKSNTSKGFLYNPKCKYINQSLINKKNKILGIIKQLKKQQKRFKVTMDFVHIHRYNDIPPNTHRNFIDYCKKYNALKREILLIHDDDSYTHNKQHNVAREISNRIAKYGCNGITLNHIIGILRECWCELTYVYYVMDHKYFIYLKEGNPELVDIMYKEWCKNYNNITLEMNKLPTSHWDENMSIKSLIGKDPQYLSLPTIELDKLDNDILGISTPSPSPVTPPYEYNNGSTESEPKWSDIGHPSMEDNVNVDGVI